jgi:hypothetical protein
LDLRGHADFHLADDAPAQKFAAVRQEISP